LHLVARAGHARPGQHRDGSVRPLRADDREAEVGSGLASNCHAGVSSAVARASAAEITRIPRDHLARGEASEFMMRGVWEVVRETACRLGKTVATQSFYVPDLRQAIPILRAPCSTRTPRRRYSARSFSTRPIGTCGLRRSRSLLS
jgi:hypothetical protein